MKKMTLKNLIFLFIGCAAAILVLGFSLSLIPSQHTPYIDGITNIINLVAILLGSFRNKEQWYFFLALDIVSVTMWILRLIGQKEQKNRRH